MRVLGLISGTSHDAIDTALVEFHTSGDLLEAVIVHEASVSYTPSVRERIIASLPPSPTTGEEICQLDVIIGEEFARAAALAHESAGPSDFIVSHGQTVFHWVDGAHARGTLQLGQPAILAERLGVPVLGNIRARDIAAGGHGAPLVSVLDALLLSDDPGASGALNLGGISNMTIVRGGVVESAYDIGAANALIDAAVREYGLHRDGYDAGGRIARSGTVSQPLLEHLLREPYYALVAPKSTGKELFHPRYVSEAMDASGAHPTPVDLVATLTELTVRTVVDAVRSEGLERLVVSGGGCRNETIMTGIRSALPERTVITSDTLGVSTDAKEAIAFALIGWLFWHGLPTTVAAATGARHASHLGSLTPGATPLRLPAPRHAPPRSIRFRSASSS